MFEVLLSPEAQDFYAAADPPLARKLDRCFSRLELEPRRHGNIRRLSGDLAGLFRYRVGDWRVLYRVDEQAQRVHLLVIAHRREVYE